MTPEEKQKVADMFSIAESFKESAELLSVSNDLLKILARKQNITFPNGKPLQFDTTILTKIMLYGLVIEINLKAICTADGLDYSHVHDHVSLFHILSDNRKDEIKDQINESFKSNFENLLENNKNAFIEWRYCYEKQNLHCDISFLQDLANVTGIIALQLAQ